MNINEAVERLERLAREYRKSALKLVDDSADGLIAKADAMDHVIDHVRRTGAMLEQTTHIQLEGNVYVEHKPNGLGWRGYIGSVFDGGVSVTEILPDPQSAFESLQEQIK